MPLNLTDFNQFYVINKICGQEKQRHYLESLGFVPMGQDFDSVGASRLLSRHGEGQ